jgi:recombination protein RecA
MAKPKKTQEPQVEEKPISKNDKLKKMFSLFEEQNKNYAAFNSKKTIIRCIDTGSPKLNDIIGIGGYPGGRVSQIYGPQGSGKTFMCMIAAYNAIKARPDSIVVWFDAERSFNYEWARKLGIWSPNQEENHLVVIKATDGVEIFERIYGKIKKDKFASKKVEPGILDLVISGDLDCSLIVIDSVASIITPKEKASPVGSVTVSALAGFLTAELRRLSEDLEKSGVALLLINQVRQSMEEWGDKYHHPGGESLRHQMSLNIYVERMSSMDSLILTDDKDKNTIIGQKVKVVVKKSRFGVAPKGTETTLLFTEGAGYEQIGVVNADLELLELACKCGAVAKGGAGWYTLPNGLKLQGDKNVQEAFENDPTILPLIVEKMYKAKGMSVNDDGTFNVEENFDGVSTNSGADLEETEINEEESDE